jgi:HK97 family phage major capsid protein
MWGSKQGKHFMANLFELKQNREAALVKAEAIISASERAKRALTAEETKQCDAAMAEVNSLNPQIDAIEKVNTMRSVFPNGRVLPANPGSEHVEDAHNNTLTPTEGAFKARQFRSQFAGWMDRTIAAVGGGAPKMEAADPSGAISIGSGSGFDSIGVTVPTEVLPYLPSYYNLDSFTLAGASQINTPHTRPLVKPILSAGAAPAVYMEGSAPSVSQPFGLSSFTFGGTKYSRLVLATYESLMNSELPLQGVILDELLSTLATGFTQAITATMHTALTSASGTLGVGIGGGGGSIYTSMIDLRHAVPPRFDSPSNKWMLSRATLAQIRNTRASTSGVPMFDPESDTIFGRGYVINDNFDTICGAGFVAYGSWADGCWIRKTPVFTRVFVERFAASGEIGFGVQQFLDSHLLAELAGAPQPPSFQPLYYTSIVSET